MNPREEYRKWQERRLDGDEWLYIWADTIERDTGHEKPLLMQVIIGADAHGKKSLLAFSRGEAEDTEAWHSQLRDLHERGMKAPRLAIADGRTNFKKALKQIFPRTQFQCSWTHIWDNLQRHLPATLHPDVANLRESFFSSHTRADTLAAIRAFKRTHLKSLPDARANLRCNQGGLFTFHEYPETHWRLLCTTDLINTSLQTVKLHATERPRRAKPTAASMLWKQAREIVDSWSPLPPPARQSDQSQESSRNPTEPANSAEQQQDTGCDDNEVLDDATAIRYLFRLTRTTRFYPYPSRYRRGVVFLYHFTSLDNLPGIRHLSALCSKQTLADNGHWPVQSGGTRRSQQLDIRNDNWDKVSLSFTPHTPMSFHRKAKHNSGDKICFFVIDPTIATLEGVEFSDTNAVSTRRIQLPGWLGLMTVNFRMVLAMQKKRITWRRWKRDVQAEVLVPDHVPLSCVKEIAFETDADLELGRQKWGDLETDDPPFTVAPCLFTNGPHYCYTTHIQRASCGM